MVLIRGFARTTIEALGNVWVDLLGRHLPVVVVSAPGGPPARQAHRSDSPGSLPTHRPQFVGLVAAVTVILCPPTFLLALAPRPLAEGIH